MHDDVGSVRSARGIVRGIHTWERDGVALVVTFHGCTHKATIPFPLSTDMQTNLSRGAPQFWRCDACAGVVPVRPRRVEPIPCIRRAVCIKLKTDDGLVEFKDASCLGKTYLVDVSSQYDQEMTNIEHGTLHTKRIVRSAALDDGNRWLPLDCLRVEW